MGGRRDGRLYAAVMVHCWPSSEAFQRERVVEVYPPDVERVVESIARVLMSLIWSTLIMLYVVVPFLLRRLREKSW